MGLSPFLIIAKAGPDVKKREKKNAEREITVWACACKTNHFRRKNPGNPAVGAVLRAALLRFFRGKGRPQDGPYGVRCAFASVGAHPPPAFCVLYPPRAGGR